MARQTDSPNRFQLVFAFFRRLILVLLVLVGLWLLYRRTLGRRNSAPPSLRAPQGFFSFQNTITLNYYYDRTLPGRPLLLVHSLHTGAASYELRALFEQYRRRRPVYALDLPGFGLSVHAGQTYSPRLYADAITALLRDQIGTQTDVVVLGNSSEFVALAALEHPELFSTLALLSPTGLDSRQIDGQQDLTRALNQRALRYRLLTLPVLREIVYDITASKPALFDYFRKRLDWRIPEGMLDLAYANARQPNAEYAALCVLSGKLSIPNVLENVYRHLQIPVLVLHDRDPITQFDALTDVLATLPNWHDSRIAPSFGWPHVTHQGEVSRAIDNFWFKAAFFAAAKSH